MRRTREIKPVATPVGKGALKRCVNMWRKLFFWALLAVGRRDGTLHRGLLEELKRVGLADDDLKLKEEFYDLNPSDEVLARVKKLYDAPNIPNLKGKTREQTDPYFVGRVKS